MKDYIDINPKTDCSSLKDETKVSFVPMPNVQEKNNLVSYDIVPYAKVKKGFTVFSKGDLIWAKITPCMQNGKSCVTNDMPTEIGFGSTEFHVIRQANKQVYMPFIWAIFSNENVLKAAQATFSGSAGQQRVPASFLERFPAVVPDFDTQVKLVSKLELKLKEKNNKIFQADKLLLDLNSILFTVLGLKSVYYESRICCATTVSNIVDDNTFSANYYHPERMAAIHMLKSNMDITAYKLSDIVDFHRDLVNVTDNDDYLGLASVESQTGELSGIQETAAGQAFIYKKGDVLYGRLRPYLNKVLFAEKSGVCSTEFHVMRVINCEKVLPEYVAAILRSDLILSQTRHMMTGNTHPRISNDDVKNLYIPVPELAVQIEIVTELHNRRVQARRLKDEAEMNWKAAKEQFEKELLGE
jgi:type I restriction enzyme S subunit